MELSRHYMVILPQDSINFPIILDLLREIMNQQSEELKEIR